MKPLQREPGQHDSAKRTLEAAYTIFLIWNNTPSIELGLGCRFSIATQQRVTPLQREPDQHDSAERTLEAAYTIFSYMEQYVKYRLGLGRRFSIATHSPSMSLGLRLARLALLPGH